LNFSKKFSFNDPSFDLRVLKHEHQQNSQETDDSDEKLALDLSIKPNYFPIPLQKSQRSSNVQSDSFKIPRTSSG